MPVYAQPFPAADAACLLPPPFPCLVPDAAGDGGETLRLRLAHMGVEIAISSGSGSGEAPQIARAEGTRTGETIHFRVGAGEAARLVGPHPAMAGDAVVETLSRALAAAERSADAFAGLYADALRLAVVARMLGRARLQAEPAAGQEVELPASSSAAPEAPPAIGPEQTPRRPRSGLVAWRLKRVLAFVDTHLAEPISLADMATASGLSRMHFAAQFRVATGLRPRAFLLRRRIELAQRMMRESREPLVQIALAVGFQTQAHFTTVFRRFAGDTPHQWRCANGA